MSSSMEKDSRKRSHFQEDYEVLQEIPFFSQFPGQALKILAYMCDRGSFEAGEVIIEEGDDHGQAMYILSGSIEATREGGQQDNPTFETGEFIGAFSLLGPMPSLYTLKAKENTKLLVFNRVQFQKLADEFQDINLKAIEAMLLKLYRWEDRRLSAVEKKDSGACGVTLL